jgi:transcription-repair coupling factor (superfamily II helicase)
MYRRDKVIKEVAQKRLKAIRQFTDLGSGYKISMKDLEIRGAGNLLGADQSGHMEAVGYDLYCKMLNDSIKRQMGQEVEEEFATSVDLPVDAYIPDDYVKNEFLKLELYKRISRFEDMEDYDAVLEEAKDRFGEPPKTFIRLLRVAYIKSLAHKAHMTDVKYKEGEVQYIMKDGTNVKVELLPKFIRKYKGRMKLLTGKYSGFSVKTDKLIQDDMLEDVEAVILDITEKLLEA